MPRLFTALWPSERAIAHLADAVSDLPPERVESASAELHRFRFLPTSKWHLTLRFHGSAEPEPLAARLDRRVARVRSAPRMRLAGAGVFRGVLWVGAECASEDDADALGALVRAADGVPEEFRAHVTIARWNSGRADRALLTGLLGEYRGPWWEADEVALVQSRPDPAGSVYRTVHRAPVARRDPGDQG